MSGLTGSEVLPEWIVDRVSQDIICSEEVLVIAVITGMAELARLVKG